MDHTDQIQRIKDKLLEARQADKALKVFGASMHKYKINPPATLDQVLKFEKEYAVQLPECYRSFVLSVGNGGISAYKSAAGPYYGIYPIGERVDELISDSTEKYLKNNCVIYPEMDDALWESSIKNIEDDNITEEEFEKELGHLWGGILPIGSQGCTYLHGLVLNGPYTGRVVNLDIDRIKPYFAFEENFLDWYERWLDEIISGELIRGGSFGYAKGDPEEVLMASYLLATTKKEKDNCISGLQNKSRLKDTTLNQIENLIHDQSPERTAFIGLLSKSNYERAKPHLIQLANTDLLAVFQIVFWNNKRNSAEWLPVIENNLDRIRDPETFRFCTYVLQETNLNYGNLLIPFTRNADVGIRVQAFYTLGKVPNKKEFVDTFIEGLGDSSSRVVHATLQALSDVREMRLLQHYKKIAERFPVEKDYIVINLNHRLAEYGLTNRTILRKNLDYYTGPSVEGQKKKWYEVWK